MPQCSNGLVPSKRIANESLLGPVGEGYRCCDTLERQDDIFVWELNPLPSYTHRHFVAYGIRPQNILSENYFPTKYFVCEKSKTPPQHQNHIHDKHAKAVLGGKKIGGGGDFLSGYIRCLHGSLMRGVVRLSCTHLRRSQGWCGGLI